MKILISNDDGYRAEGIVALYHALKQVAEVEVVAPEHNNSAKSNALTLHSPCMCGTVKTAFAMSTAHRPIVCTSPLQAFWDIAPTWWCRASIMAPTWAMTPCTLALWVLPWKAICLAFPRWLFLKQKRVGRI